MDEAIPEHVEQGAVRLSNMLFAAMQKRTGALPVFDFSSHLPAPGSWQDRAIDSVLNTLFKGSQEERIKGKNRPFVMGYSQGVLMSALGYSEEQGTDELELEGSVLKQVFESISDEDLKKGQALRDDFEEGLSLSEKTEYAEGLYEGLRAIIEGEKCRHETPANKAYILMLGYEDQLRYLETWKDFHAFICQFVDRYEDQGGFEACKKMAQRVGYSPAKERAK